MYLTAILNGICGAYSCLNAGGSEGGMGAGGVGDR